MAQIRIIGIRIRIRIPASGTVLQCKALAATTDSSMLELLHAILLKSDRSYKDVPFTLKKIITLGDIITLDRVSNGILALSFTLSPASTQSKERQTKKNCERLY